MVKARLVSDVRSFDSLAILRFPRQSSWSMPYSFLNGPGREVQFHGGA
jgi:hypothetical protein